MAATSPYSPNDYTALSNFRPYELPINDIFKGITAQSQFWDAGAARVKSAYDSALNLNLTLNENKEVRKKFLEDAEKELTKLSSMNLADPSVQRQGMKVFTPLFQDDAIMQDDYLTKLQSSVYSDAEKYKRDEKTKGEGFHMDNLAYALKDFKGFGRGTTRAQVGSIFEKAKNAEYIPHHNVSKEYLDIAAKCKPDDFSRNSIQGLYFLNRKDESQSAANLNGCIKAGISDKAWQQIKITGSVRYGDDFQALGKQYQSVIQGNNIAAAQRAVGLTSERKALQDAGKLPADLAKAYDDEIGSLNAQIKDNLVKSSHITSGDYSDVEKDYDGIVSQVYANQDIGGFAQAFAYEKVSEEYKTNPSAIAEYNQANQNARFSQTLQSNNFWKQKEFEQKEKENDISLLKAFMGGGSSSSTSSGIPGVGGTGGATYEFLKPLLQKLGIDETIISVLDSGTKVEGVGETVETIEKKANQFDHERMQLADGLLNTMKELVGPQGLEALNKAVDVPKGGNIPDAVYAEADKYITNYYKALPKEAPVSQEIQNLERMASDYQNARIQVFDFMRMRDEINTKIDKDPTLKAAKTELDNDLNNLATSSKTAITAYDNQRGTSLILYPKDLANIAKGTHDLYKFSKGQIVDKQTNVPLAGNIDASISLARGERAGGLFSGTLRGQRQIPQAGFTSVDLEGNTIDAFSMLSKYSANMKKRAEKMAPALNNIVQDVARNSTYYNVGNVPGLGNSVRQQFAEFPEFMGEDISYAPTRAYKDNDGDWVTEVQAFKESKKEGALIRTPITDDIISKLQNKNESAYSINSGFNNIKVQNGALTVKTPYLPIANDEYPISNSVKNLIYAAKKQGLAKGEILTQDVKGIVGGFKIGFDIIGGGKSFNGENVPPSFRPWYMTPDGKKELMGMQTPLENDLTNQLSAIERDMSQLRHRWALKPNTTK